MQEHESPERRGHAAAHLMTRGTLLRRAAAAGLALPTLGGVLAACGGGGESGGDDSAGPLRMTAWEAYPDQIRENLAVFERQYGRKVDLNLIPNIGYSPAIQTRLQGGQALDAYYNFAYNSTKFVDAGWAAELNDFEGVDDMLGDMFPTAAERHKLPDGRVISVPYFSAVHLPMYNARHLDENGISGPPETKEELYDQCEKLKSAGIRAPYTAYWTKQFCEEYFILYLVAEGITPFGDDGSPAFADDPRTADVLEWWKAMLHDGMAPRGVLTDDPGQHVAAMGQGNATFFVLHHYFLKEIRGTGGPQAENVELAYRMPGDGSSLQIGEVVQMGGQAGGQRAEDAWNLLKFYGWRDDEGKYRTFISWAEAAALLGPYPELFEDDEFLSAFPRYYDMEQLRDAFEQSQVVPARVAPWYASFQTAVGDRIHAMLLDQASVQDTISTLAEDARNFGAAS